MLSEPPPPPIPRPADWVVSAVWILTVNIAAFYVLFGLILPPALVIACILGAGAHGIRKGRAWSAFGLALLTVAVFAHEVAYYLDQGPELPRAMGPHPSSLTTPTLTHLSFALILCLAGWRLWPRTPRGAPWPWLAISLPIFLFPFFFRQFTNHSQAMEDTILVRDSIIATRSSSGTPKRGDIVHIRESTPPYRKFIQRVVAIPGDRLRIQHRQLYLNGKPVSEPYVSHKSGRADTYRDTFPSEPTTRLDEGGAAMLATSVRDGEVIVPPGKYFALGDNRSFADDSRYWGFLDPQNIIGRPLFIYFSFDPATGSRPALDSIPSPFIHPHRIRWSRIGKTF